MKKTYKQFLAFALSLIMMLSAMPMSAFAAEYDVAVTDDYYTIISKKDYVLCDGATESEIVLNNDSGNRRQILHVIEVDPDNTNVEVLPSYYAIDEDLTDASNWSAQIMDKQMDYYRDELGYNVVGGMNTALAYDSEAPYGLMVYNGTVLADGTVHSGAQTYLAVIKNDDGTVSFELRSTSDGLKGDEWQAVSANFGFVIKNGELVTKTAERTSAAADRSMIGIKADGTLVICQAEGRNAPYAVGLSSYEIGEAMLALGCVWAVNGDGGGSSQFLTKREGESDYSLRNIPSDGTPRATINGIIVASKAAPSGIFDHVSMIAKNQYITPGSSVEIEIKGVDASGAAAELPADGLTYEVSSGAFIDGVYTADETTGEKTITAYYNGNEVGSVSVKVVIPTSIEFISTEMVIPYGKSDVDMGLVAYYGNFEIPLETKDVTISMDNNTIGYVDGFGFTSVAEGTQLDNSSATVTATLVSDNSIVATATITLGKGSEVLYDFEDQDLHGWYRGTSNNYNYNNPAGETAIVNTNTGRVHSGNYAMAVEVDFSNSLEAGYQLGCLIVGEEITLENATRIGMWIYIPDEAYGLRIDSGISGITGQWEVAGAGEAKVTEVGFVYGFEESGWYYISKDISSMDSLTIPAGTQLLKFYISQKDGKNEYSYGDQSSVNGRYVFYVDDITVDYSSAVDDREAPIFSGMTYATSDMDESVTLVKDTSASYSPVVVTDNTVSFIATVAENTTKSNYTGINVSSGKVYIDGVDYSDKLVWTGNSKMSLNDVALSDGRHEIKFTVCDRQGNYSSVIRDIIVNSVEDAPIKVVAHDPNADRILFGSLYYIDVVASEIADVKSVNVTLDLNNISSWELDHMTVANGFESTYNLFPDENIAEINITRTGINEQTGEQILVSIPTRTWQLAPTVAIYGHAGVVWMYPNYKAGNEILPMDLSVEIDAGLVTYTDGTTDSFASARIQVYTEMSGNAYTSSGSAANNYIRNEEWYADWNGGHDHRTETAQYYAEGATNVVTPVALPDKAATCTEPGYTGRTYCEVCDSVVDWGETVYAEGHTYEVVDDKLVCACGDVLTTTGLVDVDDVTYYAIGGQLQTGWHYLDEAWYYFDSDYAGADGITSVVVIDVEVEYTFENGRLLDGVWVTNDKGTRYMYGPSCHRASGAGNIAWKEVDGVTYGFDNSGYLYEGRNLIYVSSSGVGLLYDFEGGIGNPVSAIYNNKVYIEGVPQYAYQLVELDGYYYFVSDSHLIAKNCTLYLSDRFVEGKTFADGTAIPAGLYEFDEEGKMVVTNGVYGDYLYKNGIVVKCYQLAEYEGNFYFINDGNKIAKGCTLYLSDRFVEGKTFADGTAIPAGLYEFDEEGKMVVTNGVYGDYLYKNGIVVKCYQLAEYEGNFYFINDGNKIAKGCTLYLSDKFVEGKTFADGTAIPAGLYKFDEEGRMIID